MSVFTRLRSLDASQRLGLASVVTTLIYLAWLSFQIRSTIGFIFFLLELIVGGFTILVVYNHWKRRYELMGGKYSLRIPVDVFITVVNEPLDMLERTVEAAVLIEHPATTVYILDDGGREEVKAIAKKYGCHYLSRPDRDHKRYKAPNLNYGMAHSYAPYILVLDADNVVAPTILDDLLGHFSKPNIAFVSSRQVFTVEKGDFNHDHLFYNFMQAGKNNDNAAISCGSGVIYSRQFLKKIGGFSEWNVVEDLHTSYKLHAAGYESVYVTQPYTLGHAPSDISQVYKQRGTWALDTLRIFFWQQPLLNRGLTFRQRLHYFELGYCYLVSAFFLPGIYAINFYSLSANDSIIDGGLWYVVFRLPDLVFTLLFFGRLSQGQLSSRIWAGLFPAYQLAAIKALFHRKKKPAYKVTSKIDRQVREIRLVLPQIIMIIMGTSLLVLHILIYGASLMLAINIFWFAVMFYWMWPIVVKGITKGKGKQEWAKQYSSPKTSQVY